MTTISIQSDATAANAARIAAALGYNLSILTETILEEMVRTGCVPFGIGEETPNDETIRAVEEARRIRETGEGPAFDTADALIEDILQDLDG